MASLKVKNPNYTPGGQESLWLDLKPQYSKNEVVESLGDVLKIPDEEDLTSVGNKLKLKDRDDSYGMGYVILRKDIPFKDQIVFDNTIYEIRYDFDISTEQVTILPNCILKFNGGSLNGGTLNNNSDTLFINFKGNTLIANPYNRRYCEVRPTENLIPGDYIIDSKLNKPIWWNGQNWIDANGKIV